FPTTAGAFATNLGGNADAFVTKLNTDGTALAYSTYLGGSREDYAWGIALDTTGGAYVTGFTRSEDFPTTTGAVDTSWNGSYDAFVTKLDSTGMALAYSTYIGGSNSDFGYGIALDSNGSAYVTGVTFSADFPTTTNAFD